MSDSPCGFKPFCFGEASLRGFHLALWMDATVELVRPLDSLWKEIEEDGYLFFEEDHSIGEFCRDEALATLRLTREQSFSIPSCWACVIGLDLRQPRVREFVATWKALALDGVTFPGPRWSGIRGWPRTASTDPRVKGHRYDQTAASVVAWKLGMRKWKAKRDFYSYFRNRRKWVPTYAVSQKENIARTQPTKGSSATDVLFFCRGRGRGHAIPDLAIVDAMQTSNPEVRIQFVSYHVGAETIRKAGRSVIDLELPEANPFFKTLSIAHELIRGMTPHVVVSHEEFSVPVAAAMAGRNCILLTDWFPPDGSPAAEAITYAQSVVFLGTPGLFASPPGMRCHYVGPVVRRMKYLPTERCRARSELGLSLESFVVSVVPGAWATEARAPILPTVLEAFRQTQVSSKVLMLLSLKNELVQSGLPVEDLDVRWFNDCESSDRFFVAADVVVTKCNRGTILDAASLGVPVVAISHQLNPIDMIWVSQIPLARIFIAGALDVATLRDHLTKLIRSNDTEPRPSRMLLERSADDAAGVLGSEIHSLRGLM